MMRISNDAIPKQPSMFCYNETAKLAHSRNMRSVYRQASKLLPGFNFKIHFNRGGIAVWGETYAKIYTTNQAIDTKTPYVCDVPVVEAYDTSMGLLVRQWDGKHSGGNHYVKTLEQFVNLVKELASKPFVRF
jgi:hypothetical protein